MQLIHLLLFFLIPVCTFSQQTVGLFMNSPASFEGYTLFSPSTYNQSYLIDNCGKLVHTFNGTYNPGLAAYLLDDGNLIRTGMLSGTYFSSGGKGGMIEIIDWNDSVLWSFDHYTAQYCMHHDICVMPNGHILAVAWEKKTTTIATQNGRNPNLLGANLWTEKIIEIEPVYPSGGNIVWEWHMWDHIIQDFDITKLNYGIVAGHPELLDLNFIGANPSYQDWLHVNSIDYNEKLDQIIFASRYMCEIYVIDHSTTTIEAAGHTGGNSGKGGDFLYRWGNPTAYRQGDSTDQMFYEPHGVRWLRNNQSETNQVLVFNNGVNRPGGNYSSVDIISLPVDSMGVYFLTDSLYYGPDTLDWSYVAPNPTDFYAIRVSGAQKLPNGNIFIALGPQGLFFEVDSSLQEVWRYVNPVNNLGAQNQGTEITSNGCFRADRYGPDFSGFSGRDLTPGEPIEINPLPYECNTTTKAKIVVSNDNIVLYPNPANDKIYFSGIKFNAQIKIYSLNGQCVYSGKIQNKNSVTELDISELDTGFYLLEFITSEKIITQKLIKY